MSAQVLSAMAQEEGAGRLGASRMAPLGLGGTRRGCHAPPCQPQKGTCRLSPGLYPGRWGGDALAPASAGVVCRPAVWASPGRLLQGRMWDPPSAQDSVLGRGGIQIGTTEGNPLGVQ